MNDEALIRAAQGGDAAAFEQLLEVHYNTMYKFAYKWCGNSVDAEDVVQQACIKLARALVGYRFEAAFSTWLYRLVINCAKDWHRAQQRHHPNTVQQDEHGAGGDGVYDVGEYSGAAHDSTAHDRAYSPQEEQSVYLQQILHYLGRMANGLKETVLLVHGEGLSHKEAASILDVKESTVSWRLHEVRKQLSLLNIQEANNERT